MVTSASRPPDQTTLRSGERPVCSKEGRFTGGIACVPHPDLGFLNFFTGQSEKTGRRKPVSLNCGTSPEPHPGKPKPPSQKSTQFRLTGSTQLGTPLALKSKRWILSGDRRAGKINVVQADPFCPFCHNLGFHVRGADGRPAFIVVSPVLSLHADTRFIARPAKVGQTHWNSGSGRNAARHPEAHLVVAWIAGGAIALNLGEPTANGHLPRNQVETREEQSWFSWLDSRITARR